MNRRITVDRQVLQEIIVQELPRWIEESPTLQQRLVAALAESWRPRMTYEEFLAWADEDTLAEWVDGEVVMYSPASRLHQEIGGFLYKVLSAYVQLHHLGVVVQAPFQMKLTQGREPDLLFVASAHLDRLQETHLEGPADLVVEIVSPESLARDRGTKFDEYETGGVQEYWLLDPHRRWAEFYHLETGRYRPVFSGDTGIYHSHVLPGFWLRVEWLWPESLPPVEDVLLEVGGADYARWLQERLQQYARRG